MDRICTKCGNTMEVVKSGFQFLDDNNILFTSDLWGCITCRRFQIHGSPGSTNHQFSRVKGDFEVVPDPGNLNMYAILDPKIQFSGEFNAHMIEWYPHWNWEGK